MKEPKVIVFLYSRLPEYFFRCLEFFSAHYDCRVTVIRYDDDPDTRYVFSGKENITLHYKSEINVESLVASLHPDAIVVSSWKDREYTSVARKYRKSIPVILALDNPYAGTWKQKILTVLSPLVVKNTFNRVWVAGSGQFEYARRLGFQQAEIIRDLYSADTEKFYASPGKTSTNYPRHLVYVGRMVEYKMPDMLARAFVEVSNRLENRWRLSLYGEGPLKKQIASSGYPGVAVKDFVAPKDLPALFGSAGAFCLPSHNEHWGVAVHEAAAAGMPLILSDTVGAASAFLISGFNGFTFGSEDETALSAALVKLMSLDDSGLLRMSGNSRMLSRRISHETWAAALNSVIC